MIPRYVQAPALRAHGLGPRNLFWGVAMLLAAAFVFVGAVIFTGPAAMLSLTTCLLTFTALFVLARLQVFRQRNGGFLALGLICLLGAAMPLVEKAARDAKRHWTAHPSEGQAIVDLHSPDSPPPLLTASFALSPPKGDGKQVNVLRDSSVLLEGKPYLIKAGDRFPLISVKADETTFAVRDLKVSLPSKTVEIIDPAALSKGIGRSASKPANGAATTSMPSDKDLAEITRSAQQEAMRRYPALALKDSLENAVFVSTYKQLKDAGSDDFFGNPEWPLELAELLAKREGWQRGGSPMTTGPAPVLDPPATDPATATERQPPANLPVDSLDAGAGLPRAGDTAR